MELTFDKFYENTKSIVDNTSADKTNSKLSANNKLEVNKILHVSANQSINDFYIIFSDGRETQKGAQGSYTDLLTELCKNNTYFETLVQKSWFYKENEIKKFKTPEKRCGKVHEDYYVYKDCEITFLMIRAVKAVLETCGNEELKNYKFNYDLKNNNISKKPKSKGTNLLNGINDSSDTESKSSKEKNTILYIKNYIASRGFSYPKGLIENFYLCLKTKPFVILAGVSGTGKTKLVKLFADAIGAGYKLVPVRPDWSDGSDLFGHYDLNGKFIEGPVCSIFKDAIDNPDKTYILCLDEMNLARVEYYLSDFLSVIESREKSIDNGKIHTVEIAQYKEGIPSNLYVVGTVNMDETTFPFSKKVLDRANTIEFNRVKLTPDFYSTNSNINSTVPDNDFLKAEYLVLNRDCVNEQNYVRDICSELEKINNILSTANAQVGYRVRDEIAFYMLYNKKADILTENEAFDNEIMQKILPRIQGSSSSVKDMLCDMFDYFTKSEHKDANGTTDSEKMHDILKSIKSEYPKTVGKIELMVRRFEEDGFTSFWL